MKFRFIKSNTNKIGRMNFKQGHTILIPLFLIFTFLIAQDADSSKMKVQADSLYQLGKQLQKAGKGVEALPNLDTALSIYRQLDLKKEIGIALNRIGLAYGQNLGDWPRAEKQWLEALEVRVGMGDKKGTANVSNNLAIAYANMGRYSKAEKYYKHSLEFRREIMDTLRVSAILKNIGLLKLKQDMFYEAEEQLTESLALADRINNEQLRGEIINNLGLLAYSRGLYGDAHRNYTEALNILGDRIGTKNRAEIMNNLGTVYRAYGDTVSAIIHYFKSLELCEQTGNKDLKARIYNNLGNYYQSLGQYDKGLEYLNESLLIKEEIQNRKGIVATLTNIGNLFRNSGNYDKAKEFYLKAKKQAEELCYIYYESKILYGLGTLELENENYQRALDHYGQGITLAERISNPYLLYQFFNGMGDCYYRKNELEFAKDSYRNSITNIETIRKGIGLEEHRSSFMSNALDVYRSMVTLQIQLGNEEDAYTTYERMKARNLLDILDGAFLVFEDDLTAEQIEKEQFLENQLRGVNKQISHHSFEEEATRSLDSLVSELSTVRREIDNFKAAIFFSNPDLMRKMGEGEPIETRDAVKLLNLNEAAIAYLVHDDETICFVLRRKSRRQYTIKTFHLNIPRSEIERSTTNLLAQWQGKTSAYLYDSLIEPFKASLEGVTQLCVIPDSYLNNLPFHALKNSATGEYLIEEYAVYYVNSLSALEDLRSFGTAGKERLLAFGNPDFGSEGIATLRGELASLPATEDEVNAIREIYQDRSRILIGTEAREENFKSLSREYGILHLATHGVMDELNPMYSAILLSADENNDGFLTAREILKTELNADLAVLSACETATGKLTEGEGMLGLSRAFFGAAVPALVASLWPVGDVSTRILMETFYYDIENGIRPAKALRNAQLTLKENPQYKHPFFWAPFIFIGDTE